MKFFGTIVLAMACLVTAALQANVVINEIHYDPAIKTDLAEFVELHNNGSAGVSVAGWQLSGGVEFIFPAGASIAPGGYLVVAENPGAFARKFPGRTALGPWAGLLASEGEQLTVRDEAGRVVDQVEYQLGFPWPTVGSLPGYSIELINPAFDNDLGGNWRASVKGTPASGATTLVQAGTSWRYQKGVAEASTPSTAWRNLNFADSAWPEGPMPIGYDPSIAMGTTLSDMRGSYTSVFLRKKFTVADPAAFGALRLEAMYDDGFKLWINGKSALTASMPSGEAAYNAVATGGARESSAYDVFSIPSPASLLQAGENIIAVQLHNVSLADSSDAYIDLRLIGELGSANAGPTPGARNAAYDTNAAPQIRQVAHAPEQPHSGQPVIITAKITDPDGVAAVELQYQLIDPGSYIELNDAAYATTWTSAPMNDNGTSGDLRPADSIFTGVLPASLQTHRRLVRYRLIATDAKGMSVRAPYLDDPEPNFAYFVYDGVPDWSGAARPGSTAVQTFSSAEMSRLPAYHLIAKKTSVENATWNSKYTGDLYQWWGTLVYEGKVYDHIRYRARGGVWRYAMGKNMWKFDFNRGHDFEPRDDYGKRYKTTWRKLNLGANIQQGDFQHRGEQGMFESVGFRFFNLAGVESPKTHWATLRVVDENAEASASSQYNGDFWGLYLAIEQEDGRFLEEHDLPDGNLYKMEGYNGELNNQGRYAATDKSDIDAFTGGYRNVTPTEQWWRQNFDVDRYYSYQAVVQGIHHYDICYGKNYFYYLNPESAKWQVVTWDLDLTWADNMYDAGCGAVDEFKNRITTRAPFSTEYKNRVRELRDLLFNTDEAWRVIDEHASIVKGGNAVNILAADRAMWDYNPVMNNSSIVNPGKAGQGRFYQFPLESANDASLRGSFEAGVQIMKNYVVARGAVLDGLAADAAIPARPIIRYDGPGGYPVNRLAFRSSRFSGSGSFAAAKWRIGEVRPASGNERAVYEIEPVWESGESAAVDPTAVVPSDAVKVGHTYRARARIKDTAGRWSQWSAPIQFTAGEPDNAAALAANLRVSEVMYNPPAGNDLEFVELLNSSASLPLSLEGAVFTAGIDFVFPAGASLAPGEYALVIRGTDTAFRAHYGLGAGVKIFGRYDGALNNDGERITLKTAAAGQEIVSFAFKDRAEWPIAADGAGHSLVPKNSGNLDYGRNWRASLNIGGSPGLTDPAPADGVVINEIASHTDYVNPNKPEYDSNDWIELLNQGAQANLGDLYLSDQSSDLKKWRLPNVTLDSGARVSFDEVSHFHTPITSGFGLNKAGEEVYLSSFPASGPGRVVDAIRFKGQESELAWGRHPDGGEFFYTLAPTRDQSNVRTPGSAVISEIMYRPGLSNTVEEAWREYVELHNPAGVAVLLSNTNGPFRIDGGIAFVFPSNASILPGGTVVLVSFDPTNTTERDRFLSAYGIISSNVVLHGPFTGRLDNSSDRVALEKAEAPDVSGEGTSWVIVDEAIYTNESGANGDGRSLFRNDFSVTGNDPSNLRPGAPTPGGVASSGGGDRDGDGMPDEWESANGLNPDSAADAASDSDADGASNLAEYRAGTDPRNGSSVLRLSASRDGEGVRLGFSTVPGRTYAVEYRETFSSGGWIHLRDVTGAGGSVEVVDSTASGSRFYRVTTASAP